MITLTLLHPLQSIPVRTWTFDEDVVIRIGRSTKNHVVLYSSVVSRHHVELRRVGDQWMVINLGTNGTYLNGQPITQAAIEDGQIIHLAISGPKIRLSIQENQFQVQPAQVGLKPATLKTLNAASTQMQVERLTTPSPPPITLPDLSEDVTEADKSKNHF